ncbi:MAG: EAL domain-containing protein [Siculibacillus sp.]|nr:EAL domain-containing protein [Siculibacillus sp.]
MAVERYKSYVMRVVATYALFASLWIFFSDLLLAGVADEGTLLEISVFKGLFFVATSAVLLTIAFLRAPRGEPKKRLRGATASAAPIVALTAAVVAVLGIAHFAYRTQSAMVRTDAIQKLEALSHLEVDAIARWLEQRRGDAEVLARDPLRRERLSRWLETRDAEDAESLEETLAILRGSQSYHGVALVDSSGTLLLGDEQARSDTPEFRAAVARAGTGTRVVLLDLHKRQDGSIHMAWLAPIYDPEMTRGEPLAVAVLDVDSATWLNPFLAAWPMPSRTGENALVRREGDAVVPLVDTRLGHGEPLARRIPLDRVDLPAVRHVRFGDTTATGKDYRGERVIAAMATIPATGWTLVAKMDEAEALAEIEGLAFVVGLSIIFALTGGLGIAVLLWQRQRLDAAYREIDQRHRAQAAEERFRSTFEQAAVGIAHVGLDGSWIRCNRRLAAIAGYEGEDLMGVPIAELVHPAERFAVARSLFQLARNEKTTVTTQHRIRHRDGSIVWVAVTASIVRDAADAAPYVVAVIEDISARRAAEEALRASEERFDLAMRGSADGLWDWDLATGEIFRSPRCREILGFDTENAGDEWSNWKHRVHPDDRPRAEAHLRDVITGRAEALSTEFRLLMPDGAWRHILSRGFVVRDGRGRALRVVGTHADITDRKRDEADLRRAAAVFTNSQEGVVITDARGRVIDVNPAFTTITGWPRDAIVGDTMRRLHSGRHDPSFYTEMWKTIDRIGHWQGEIWNRRRDGEIFPEWLTISSVRDETGRIANYVGTFIDIGQIKQSEARLSHLAHHDPLTDLPNRVLLLDELDRAIESALHDEVIGAVLFLDLDRFKNVNDSLGHAAGDELLWLVSQRLREVLPAGAMLARLGGDEFVGLVRAIEGREPAAELAHHLIERLDQPFVLTDGQEIFISTSIGISLFPTDGRIANELIQHADTALYEAKAAGRATHRFYEEVLTAAAANRLETEAGLRRALERGEFELHYQPQVTTSDGRVRGVEALLRWRDPIHGLIMPDRFIPIAEETGLIIPIGEWVLRNACRQMREWIDAGIGLDTVAVNLSPREFQRADVPRRIADVLAETGVPARHLEIEITEGALMDQGPIADRRLAALRELGVRLSIDDFGTGWSSLAYLRRLPIDKLKIDRSFVADMPDDPTSVEITSAIVSLARNLKLEVLAEGVETRAQFDELVRLGCDFVQGWLFAPPLPAADIPLLLGKPAAGRQRGRRKNSARPRRARAAE